MYDLSKIELYFGIELVFGIFDRIKDLDIGGIARAQTGNNKVVIATRLSLTKSLHVLSLL